MNSYKEKIYKVSRKIDHWHENIQKIKKGTFVEDDEFLINQSSPDRFDSYESLSFQSCNSSH